VDKIQEELKIFAVAMSTLPFLERMTPGRYLLVHRWLAMNW
jgi:hypothetical protein